MLARPVAATVAAVLGTLAAAPGGPPRMSFPKAARAFPFKTEPTDRTVNG
jgi:hypothetical protein